jgi:antitoxin PrlF
MRSTVTSKGQVTIPQAIRRRAKIAAGSQLEFQFEDDNTLIVHLVSRDVASLKGIVKFKHRKPVTLAEMKATSRFL